MTDVTVEVNGLSKRYFRAAAKIRHDTLRDLIMDSVKAPLRRAAKLLRGHATGAAELDEEFWAVKDVSFEVKRGEVLGIIGRNGAGKSTLLKILSRITEPTSGHATIRGRLGSLLEVGTAFHPELTGRENTFLNGAILGMRKEEVKARFDEIVEFSGVSAFLDTPVKHYSSGMTVRLAFAVAAHLEPEVLIIDEVLAVGDAAFQRRCLDKMRQVTEEGRTVLFVSHNMSAVAQLCDRAILLVDGQVRTDGQTDQVINEYLTQGAERLIGVDGDVSNLPRNDTHEHHIMRVEINGIPITDHHLVGLREPMILRMEVELKSPRPECAASFHFDNQQGETVFALSSTWTRGGIDIDRPGRYTFECRVDHLPLIPGNYYLTLGVASQGRYFDAMERVSQIEIKTSDVFGTGNIPRLNRGSGYVLMPATWTLEPTP